MGKDLKKAREITRRHSDRSGGERYPMIRVSSNSPASFCGGAASRRKVCAIWSVRLRHDKVRLRIHFLRGIHIKYQRGAEGLLRRGGAQSD